LQFRGAEDRQLPRVPSSVIVTVVSPSLRPPGYHPKIRPPLSSAPGDGDVAGATRERRGAVHLVQLCVGRGDAEPSATSAGSPVVPHDPPIPTSLADALPGCWVRGAGRGAHPRVPPASTPHVPKGRWVPPAEAAAVGGCGGPQARWLQGQGWRGESGQGTHGCPLSPLSSAWSVLRSLLLAEGVPRQGGGTQVGVPWH